MISWIKNVSSVVIGTGSQANPLTSIGDYAFQYCNELTSMSIPDSVTNIGRGAFHSCEGLPAVTIPNSVTSIGAWAFQFCSGLTSVTFEGRDKSTVQGMTNYPFGLNYASINGATIHCTDGDIQIYYSGE